MNACDHRACMQPFFCSGFERYTVQYSDLCEEGENNTLKRGDNLHINRFSADVSFSSEAQQLRTNGGNGRWKNDIDLS